MRWGETAPGGREGRPDGRRSTSQAERRSEGPRDGAARAEVLRSVERSRQGTMRGPAGRRGALAGRHGGWGHRRATEDPAGTSDEERPASGPFEESPLAVCGGGVPGARQTQERR